MTSARQLRHFVTVADEGQMTRAAARLHVAQPAVSQSIAQLESELGIQLFERHPRGLTLTPDGEVFLGKARTALAAFEAVDLAAQSLVRADTGVIEFGFVGSPPGLDSPAALAAFSEVNPGVDVLYRALPFPSDSTSAWLEAVDVAVCHVPPPDQSVWSQELRREPRAVLAPKRHPLAQQSEVGVGDVIEETFIGLHPSLDPAWAGFWSLDTHRGGPPRDVTPDRARDTQEVLAALAVRCAITTVPASVARLVSSVPTELVAIPLRDAEPAIIMLVGHEDTLNPCVASIRAFARTVTGDGTGY